MLVYVAVIIKEDTREYLAAELYESLAEMLAGMDRLGPGETYEPLAWQVGEDEPTDAGRAQAEQRPISFPDYWAHREARLLALAQRPLRRAPTCPHCSAHEGVPANMHARTCPSYCTDPAAAEAGEAR